MTHPQLITLEGSEGAGKSTQCALLSDALSTEFGVVVTTTREPGGTALGEALRGLLLDPKLPAMDATAELLLMFAARAEHLARVIVPALERGEWVVCDRFTDATFAYQGGGRGIEMGMISALEDLVQKSLRPNLTLLLDLDVDRAFERTSQRGSLDRFESEQREFFERIRQTYLARARAEPRRFLVIDAAADIDTVHRRIMDALMGRLT